MSQLIGFDPRQEVVDSRKELLRRLRNDFHHFDANSGSWDPDSQYENGRCDRHGRCLVTCLNVLAFASDRGLLPMSKRDFDEIILTDGER